jgi:hypothetical protein
VFGVRLYGDRGRLLVLQSGGKGRSDSDHRGSEQCRVSVNIGGSEQCRVTVTIGGSKQCRVTVTNMSFSKQYYQYVL